MKRLFLLPILCLLIGCRRATKSSEITSYEYSDFSERFIEWTNLLSLEDEKYYGYVFSYTCGHCVEIKQDILSAIKEMNWNIYLIEFTYEIPILASDSEYRGITNIDDLGIVGTPTLFYIENKTVIERYTGSREIIMTFSNSLL